MNPETSPLLGDANEEVFALIETLHRTERRLEELTAGEVDTVADREGRPFLLGRAQEQLRYIEAAKQAAILNALPAHIALLDTQGVIVSVNEAWRRFGVASGAQCPGYDVGVNYLEICDSGGAQAREAHQAAAGIRAVLARTAKSFACEYLSAGPGEARWFLMAVTPLAAERPSGAVVMHLDITQRKQAEIRIKRLNRVYAVLSGINTLIVRARDRGELLKEACRIAVQSGQFPLAFVAVADPRDQLLKAVAWAGDERGLVQVTRPTVDAKGQGKAGLAAQAIEKRVPVICNDIETDGSAMRYPKESLERGYRSAAALPLVVDGAAVGALVLYAAEAGAFDDEETKLLAELAGDISLALDHVEKAEKVRRLTRVHAVLSGINTLIVRVRDRGELLDGACRTAVGAGGFRMAWIGIVERSTMMIEPVASAGAEPDYMALIRDKFSLAEGSPMGNTLTAQSIRENKVVFSNDAQNDPRVRFKQEHVKRGTRSIAFLPLLVADEAVGVLVLCTEEADFFDAAELELLAELASNISFALDHIEKEKKLNDSESRFRQMADNIRDVFFLVDAQTHRTLYVSLAFEQIWGRTRESIYANTDAWTDSIHPQDRAATSESYQKGMAAGEFEYEYRIIRPDGSIRWIQARGFPVRDDKGRLFRITGVAEDITARKLADEVLAKRAAELERFHRLSVGRELQMIELKKQANALAILAGQKPPHDLAFLRPKP